MPVAEPFDNELFVPQDVRFEARGMFLEPTGERGYDRTREFGYGRLGIRRVADGVDGEGRFLRSVYSGRSDNGASEKRLFETSGIELEMATGPPEANTRDEFRRER